MEQHPLIPSTPFATADLLEEISREELAELLDDHLLDIVRMSAELGEPISREKSNVYYHLRRIRNMLKSLDQ